MTIKEKLAMIKKLACDVKRIEKGYEFKVGVKSCKMSIRPRGEIYRNELLLSCDIDLVIDDVLWLGITYGNGSNFDYKQDMIDLYAHMKSLLITEQAEKQAEVNNFISSLET